MDFANKNLGVLLKIGDETIYFSESLLSTWIVMGLLIVAAVAARLALTRFRTVPRGPQNVIEAIVEAMSNFAKSTMGDRLESFGGIYFSVFAFILLANYIGLVGLRPPTADLATTAALGIVTFAMVQYGGIRRQKGQYFKSFFKPYPIFFPINLVGELSKPVSLAFRLFGNMLGGLIVVGLVYEMAPLALRFLLPDVLHAYFDFFAGALQAFIFTVLSMTFIRQKATPD
ncbi:MAG: F0F1 ATP synthase subunit A [Clostridiales bacterium]|nr:F0F1 ATP synthase subunit A [Clostridiales bacterium]